MSKAQVATGARKRGHPEVYDKAVADEIIARMSDGETLQEICETPGFPKASTVRYWAATDKPAGFAATFARARELQAGSMFDKLILKSQEQGDWQSLRLQVDTLKWAASKLHPKIYGDKVQTEHSGSIDFRPQPIGKRDDLERDGEGS